MRQSLQKLRAGAHRLMGLSVALWLVVGMMGCTAFRLDVTTPRTEVTLSTWGSAQEMAVLRGLLAEFERQRPDIRVNLMHIPDNYYQKLHILVAGGLAPDVMLTNSISFPVYAAHGVFRDLGPDLQRLPGLQLSDFYAPALTAMSWTDADGTVRLGALPRDISNVVVYYNRDWFRRAGLPDPSPQWDWETFVSVARRLTDDTDGDGRPDRFGVSFYSRPPLFWLPFVWSAGGDLLDPAMRRVTLGQPAALAGLQFYADLRHRWHVAPRKVDSGGVSMSELFLQQRVAMLISGRWSVPVFREQARFDWDVVPLPVGPSGQSRVGIDASGYAVSAHTPHPDAALALVWFLSSRDAIAAVAESGLIVPARPDVAESAQFLAPEQAPRHGRVFLDVIPTGVPTRTPPRWNEFSEELLLGLEPVWDGQQGAQTAVRAVTPKLERLLEARGGS